MNANKAKISRTPSLKRHSRRFGGINVHNMNESNIFPQSEAEIHLRQLYFTCIITVTITLLHMLMTKSVRPNYINADNQEAPSGRNFLSK